MIRIAHLADFHFSKLTFHPNQFCSKRWIGNISLMLLRKRKFLPSTLYPLIDILSNLKVEYVLITGDLTSTSRCAEFKDAKKLITTIEERGMKVITLPGNHDQYTKKCYKKQKFYSFFPNPSLEKNKVDHIPLNHNWHLLLLDTAIATSLFSSQGSFSPQTAENLHKALQTIPPTDNIILVNHFPLFHTKKKRRTLLNCEHLQKLIQSYPNIKIYLHGHAHHHIISDLRPRFPIIMDCGSVAMRRASTWNLLELLPSQASVTAYRADKSLSKPSPHWEPFTSQQFTF